MTKEIKHQLRALADELHKTIDKRIIKIEREDNPIEQPAPAVRLWCAKSCEPGYAITKGNVYKFESKKPFPYDGMMFVPTWDSYKEWARGNPGYSKYLFPLVKRPAKEGEWVLVSNSSNQQLNKYKNGDVLKCKENFGVGIAFGHCGIWERLNHNEYEVIDGYHGEYEQPEELLQGAVVCIKSECKKWMILGKKYAAVDGRITFEDGYKTEPKKSIDDFNNNWEQVKIARLIEDEGEK